jgi:hypothetical protein
MTNDQILFANFIVTMGTTILVAWPFLLKLEFGLWKELREIRIALEKLADRLETLEKKSGVATRRDE